MILSWSSSLRNGPSPTQPNCHFQRPCRPESTIDPLSLLLPPSSALQSVSPSPNEQLLSTFLLFIKLWQHGRASGAALDADAAFSTFEFVDLTLGDSGNVGRPWQCTSSRAQPAHVDEALAGAFETLERRTSDWKRCQRPVCSDRARIQRDNHRVLPTSHRFKVHPCFDKIFFD